MPRILDYSGRDVERTVTVSSIVALKSQSRQYAQTTASTAEEAAAAEAAGIEMVACMADSVPAVREGSSRVFVTAAIDFGGEVSVDDLLATAFRSLNSGADAVITARRLEAVELLASEDIPVMGHLGFVPKKSTVFGGVRPVGRTATEANELWTRFQLLEDAGAFAVECELIPANVMAEINQRTNLATISLGSGPHADVMFLFSSDICGDGPRIPRHARAWGNIASLRSQIVDERVAALTAFRSEIEAGTFPDQTEVVQSTESELARFVATTFET